MEANQVAISIILLFMVASSAFIAISIIQIRSNNSWPQLAFVSIMLSVKNGLFHGDEQYSLWVVACSISMIYEETSPNAA